MANDTKSKKTTPKKKAAPHELPGVTITASKGTRVSEQKSNGSASGWSRSNKPATYKKGQSTTTTVNGVTKRTTATAGTKISKTSNGKLYKTPVRTESVSFDKKKK